MRKGVMFSLFVLFVFNTFAHEKSLEYFYQSVLKLKGEKEKVVINFSIKENDSLIIYQSKHRVKIIDIIKEEVVNISLDADSSCFKLPRTISVKIDSSMNGGYES